MEFESVKSHVFQVLALTQIHKNDVFSYFNDKYFLKKSEQRPKPPVTTEAPVVSGAPATTEDMKFPLEILCRAPCMSPEGVPWPGNLRLNTASKLTINGDILLIRSLMYHNFCEVKNKFFTF